MGFSGAVFLYYFLPGALALYFLCPKGWRRALLLGESLVFYAWAGPKYLPLLLGMTVLGWGFGLLMEKLTSPRGRKTAFAAFVLMGLCPLLLSKYGDFLLSGIGTLTGTSLPLLRLGLPLGISFYTFSVLSYGTDVYRGKRAEKNLLSFALYMTFFPKLTSGPIARYEAMEDCLKSPQVTLPKAAHGVSRFVVGLGKKVLIADRLALLVSACKGSSQQTVLLTWLYALGYTLQLYFDFSGYSDMAIGLGEFLGFSLPENFSYPYMAKSLTDFWRRWHMTLGSWFRDYLYIPLGGKRKGKPRWMLNLLIVWGATGLWHGAGWNFILWGLFFGILLMGEKLFLLPHLNKSRLWGRVYVWLCLLISFILFDNTNLSAAFGYVRGLFGGLPLASVESLYLLRSYGILLILGLLGATPLPKKLWQRAEKLPCMQVLQPVGLGLLLLLCTAYILDGSFVSFMYFRF